MSLATERSLAKIRSMGALVALDVLPLTPSATVYEPFVVYAEGAGTITGVTAGGSSRTIAVADNSLLPILFVSVTAATATGLHRAVLLT
jgi:hypothetical protein